MPYYGTTEWNQLLEQLHNNDPALTKVNLFYSPTLAGARQLADALQYNTTLLELTLSGGFTDEEVKTIVCALFHHPTLATLEMWCNQICDEGIKAIATLLQQNTKITKLDLRENQINNKSAIVIAKALQQNASLIEILLNKNQIGDEGVIALAITLQHNTSLRKLFLSENQVSDEGAKALAKALQQNTSLIALYLVKNQIGNTGAEAIANALQSNTTLEKLLLWGNRLEAEGLQALYAVLKSNITLISFIIHTDQSHQPLAVIRNNFIQAEKNPIKKANLIGKVKGTYSVPSLLELGLFAVKSNLSETAVKDLQPNIPEEIYLKLTKK